MNEIRLDTLLYGVSSSGKTKTWKIDVVANDDGTADIVTEHGYLGQKITKTIKKIKVGKNIGKSNETTPYQQAVSEAVSTFKEKLDKQYRTTLEASTDASSFEIELPMLAHKYKERKHNIVFPCYVQPKLNGVRCLSKRINETIRSTSRSGKLYSALYELMSPLLDGMDDGQIMDGEVFSPHLTFEEITTAVKNEVDLDPNLSRLEYWIYDTVSSKDFKERLLDVHEIVGLARTEYQDIRLVIVPTYLVQNEEELMRFHNQFSQEGFEGTMIRNMEGGYELKNRSVNLQKLKDFMDEEFEIVGGEEGTGLAEGQCVFICKAQNGDTFNVRCRGTNAIREEQWKNLPSYIGKMLTVRFQNYSSYGIPIFPVGICVRDYE